MKPGTSDYCYVLRIPQSTTAHQALDLKYYKRRNFESTAMEDYEIRDVMYRRKHPALTAEARISLGNIPYDNARILIRVTNTSRVMAKHFAVIVSMPIKVGRQFFFPEDATVDRTQDDLSCWLFSFDNSGGSPLFPSSQMILKRKLKYFSKMEPEPGASISDIRLKLYADEMEKVTLAKNVEASLKGWT